MIDALKRLFRTKPPENRKPGSEEARLEQTEYPELLPDPERNAAQLKSLFGESSDFQVHRLKSPSGLTAMMLFIGSISDKALVDEHVAKPLLKLLGELERPYERLFERAEAVLSSSQVTETCSMKELVNALLQGSSIVMLPGCTRVLACSTSGGERRSVSEGTRETVVRGSHEAFTESLETNLGLVRRRIRSPKLQVEQSVIGTISNTPLAVLYLDGVAPKKIVEQVRERLKNIRIDGAMESLYIEEFIEDPAYTPFPTVFNTERPDRVAACLLEGRIAIALEGTPSVLVVPATISLFLYSNEDYYQRFDISSLLKLLRTTTFMLSFFLPGFYVALLTFHQEMLPTPLLIALTGQREGVPFGAAIEIACMELAFEILREAGLRLPKTVGTAVSIVGGLVLGQAAVEAGLVAPGTVITVSLTAIASFTTPAYNMAIAARMLRFFLLGCSAVLGAFGFFFGVILIFTHLNTLRSFGVPYLSPIVPFHWSGWKDLFIRVPWNKMSTRPPEISSANQVRLSPDSKEPAP